MYTGEENNQSSGNIVTQAWAKYFPYWPLFLILMAASAFGAWVYLSNRLPVYEASATLLIKDEKKGSQDSKMVESIDLLTSKKIIENEVEVIKSRTLVGQVVKELALYAPVSQDGDWKNRSAYSTSPIKIEAQNPDSLLEVKRVDFTYKEASGEISFAGQKANLNDWTATPWGTLKFSRVNSLNASSGKYYFSIVSSKRIVQNLINRIDAATTGKLSSVLVLKIKDEVPQRAEAILNGLIAAYDRAAVNDKNILATNTLSFLQDRLQFVSHDLDSIEKAMQRYRAGKGAIDISAQGKLFLQNVSDNDKKVSDVNMRLSVLAQIEKALFAENQTGLVPTALGFEDPLLSGLLTRMYDLGLEYEKIKKTTGEANPQAVALADQIKKLKPNILENIRSQRKSLEISKENLNASNSGYNSQLRALPEQERDLVEISRQQNIKSSIYSYLLQKKEEAALSHSSTVSDTRIVDNAQSSLEPAGIGGKIIYAAAILVGLIVGITFITLRELFNNKILYRQEIESMTRFPVIGEVARVKSKSSLVLFEGDRSVVAGQFRLIRTSLPYLGIHGRGKKVLVTSTLPGEGKSFIAVNLAMSLAMGGKKVVLVEFDLSNPTLSYKLDMETNLGVADYLAGDAEAEQIIKRTDTNDNLFLVAAGNLPNNPSELILSNRTKKLLDYLENAFDYILIDSAPVGLVSDGYVLGRYCDACLYVVRHKHTSKRMLERLEHNNKINELKNIALIFNGVHSRGFGHYGYGYGYGYSPKNKRKAYSK